MSLQIPLNYILEEENQNGIAGKFAVSALPSANPCHQLLLQQHQQHQHRSRSRRPEGVKRLWLSAKTKNYSADWIIVVENCV